MQEATSREEQIRCPSCGTLNRAAARWCVNCTVRLVERQLAPVPGRSKATKERRQWMPRLLVAAVAVLTITTLVFGLATFAPSISPLKTPAQKNLRATREIERVADRFAQNLMTYDYRTLQSDFARVRADTTTDFFRHYQSALGGTPPQFENAISQRQTVSTSDIKASDLRSHDAGTATVVVLISQTTRQVLKPQPSTSFLALEIALVRTNAGWKVDAVGNAANPNPRG